MKLNTTKQKNKIVTFGLFVAVFLVYVYYLCAGINLPYVGPNATNFNEYSLIAKNYNLFGFWETRLGQIVSVSKTMPDKPEYYLHHPPLISVVEALLFRLFGNGFWVGRLAVILFSVGSLILIYLIAGKLADKEYALIAAFVFTFMPGTTIFGRMIGQEALVLFFSLLTVYYVLLYLDQKKRRFICLLTGAVMLGTLSDWPMTYFTALISVFLIYKREFKLAGIILATTTITALLFLVYVYVLMSGFSNLRDAIVTRSLGELVGQSVWPLRWIAIIVTRFIVYFNPIFVLLGFYYVITGVLAKKENKLFLITLVFFGFGSIHILLYPEGSFGHPYWIYYFAPFVAFASSHILRKFYKRNLFIFISVVISAIFFIVLIQHWKLEQTKSNVWRYTLAQKADSNLTSYEAIEINQGSAIDPDLYNYAFEHEVKMVGDKKQIDIKKYKHFVYSCMTKCARADSLLKYLIDNYKNKHFTNPDGEAYLFDLGVRSVRNRKTIKDKDIELNKAGQTINEESMLRKIYRSLKTMINAPQI